MEAGSRGFVGKVVVQLLRSAGLTGTSLRKAVRSWERRPRRRAAGCGFGGRKMDGGKHTSKGSYREWQGDVPIRHCTPAQRCTGLGGETSVKDEIYKKYV